MTERREGKTIKEFNKGKKEGKKEGIKERKQGREEMTRKKNIRKGK